MRLFRTSGLLGLLFIVLILQPYSAARGGSNPSSFSSVPSSFISSSRYLLNDNALPSLYCQPTNSSCWPTPSEWLNFNLTVFNGQLLTIQPPGYPCFINPNSSACQDVYANFINPNWRSSLPGAMQAPQWEGDSEGNDCNNPLRSCSQGNIPLYGVQIFSPNDIVTVLNFAKNRNIRIIIKTSGHDWLGRSTAPDALLVWMHTYKGININPAVPSVTVNSGENWETVYNSVYPTYTIVGGSSNTVGASGGYILGGGHGFASAAYGLSVDNVLSFSVVLANGTILSTVSDTLYPDLFWALRGGGSGIAIVTSTTYKLYPSPPPNIGVTGVALVLYLKNGVNSLEKWLNAYLPIVSDLDKSLGNGAGVVAGGTVYILPQQSLFATNFVFNGTKLQAQTYMNPIENLTVLLANETTIISNDYNEYPNMREWWWKHDANGTSGVKMYIGSRFLPYSLCSNTTALPTAVTKLSNALWKTSGSSMRVLGGSVRTSDSGAGTDYGNYKVDLTKTSISPYFRDAFLHILIGEQYPTDANGTVQNYTRDTVAGWVRELEDAIPSSGVYWGEAEYTDPLYEYNIWGFMNNGTNTANCTNTSTAPPTTLYGKLQQIKYNYDPTGYLNCYHCVQLPLIIPTCGNTSNTTGNNTNVTPSPVPSYSASSTLTPTPTPTSTPLNASAVPTASPTSTATLSTGATPSNTPSNIPLQPSISPSASASYGTRSIRDASFVLWDVPINVYALPSTLDVLVFAIQTALANMVNINTGINGSTTSNANFTRFQQAVTVSLTVIQDLASNRIIFSSRGYSGNNTNNGGGSGGGGNNNNTNYTDTSYPSSFSTIRTLLQDTNGGAGSEGVLIQYTILIPSANVSTYYSSLRNIAYLYTRSTDYVSFITRSLRTEASKTGIPEIANGFNGVEVTPTRNRNGGDSNGTGGNPAGTAVGITFLILVILGIILWRRRKAKAAATAFSSSGSSSYVTDSRRQRVYRSSSGGMNSSGTSFRQPYPAYAYEMSNSTNMGNVGTAPPMDNVVTSDWRINNSKTSTSANIIPSSAMGMMNTPTSTMMMPPPPTNTVPPTYYNYPPSAQQTVTMNPYSSTTTVPTMMTTTTTTAFSAPGSGV